MEMKDRIIVPIDTNDIDKALEIVINLRNHVGMFKFGLELITSMIVQLVISGNEDLLGELQYLFHLVEGKLFWDGKWDDIPNTVKGATLAMSPLKPKIVNVHASAGETAIRAAVQNSSDSLVLGVTILTSISNAECVSIFGNWPKNKVVEFANMLVETKADGIICSPQELVLLKDMPLIKVTPGVRPTWASKGDQKRVMSPGEAIQAGADYLVIGRPITNPPEEVGTSLDAIDMIVEEMEAAVNG
jgi:orotidine-5'-phosphate decarboxylase